MFRYETLLSEICFDTPIASPTIKTTLLELIEAAKTLTERVDSLTIRITQLEADLTDLHFRLGD